jgi:hypothetical protein
MLAPMVEPSDQPVMWGTGLSGFGLLSGHCATPFSSSPLTK